MMNAAQQKELARIYHIVEKAAEDAQTLATELQDAFDARSEKWQESEKGQEAQEQIDSAQAFADALADARDTAEGEVTIGD